MSMNKKKEQALDNKCPGCGAPIHFSPTSGNWKCEYCNSEFSLEEMQKHNNASSELNNSNLKQSISENNDDISYVTYKCKNCGAEIIADEQTAATFCVYCGSTAILHDKLSGGFTPDLIIPFKIEKDAAIKAFEGLSKGRPFVPKDFNNKNNIEKIKGIYIPFWLYDLQISGSLNFNGQKVKSWSTGNTHYVKTDYYKIFRTGSMNFKRIPVDGSTRFDNATMNSIEPFNYEDLVKYNHAYLSGFFAEKFDVNSDVAIADAINRALESGKQNMLNSAPGYSSKIIFENTLNSNEIKKEYVLLPVWMVNVKYNDKYHLFAMNGQTGEFIGDIPLDKKKVWIWSILLFLSSIIIVTIISYILFLMR